jgi:hypothetical protein
LNLNPEFLLKLEKKFEKYEKINNLIKEEKLL